MIMALRSLLPAIMVSLGCWPIGGCAVAIGLEKAPQEVWEKLARGEPQDLIVVFDDTAVQAQARQMNAARGIQFDDEVTMRFKAERYAAMKEKAIATLPSGSIQVLRNFDSLPMMFLRFRSVEHLKHFLESPLVIRAHEDRMEKPMPPNARP